CELLGREAGECGEWMMVASAKKRPGFQGGNRVERLLENGYFSLSFASPLEEAPGLLFWTGEPAVGTVEWILPRLSPSSVLRGTRKPVMTRKSRSLTLGTPSLVASSRIFAASL